MKLLVVSHTEHYADGGRLVGWGPTVREIDYLSTLFDQVVHIAPLHPGKAPQSALPYQSDRVVVRVIKPAGGERLAAKLGVVLQIPRYVRTIRKELRTSDVVHVRCPANISMIALGLLALVRRPAVRWVKYAGNWQPSGGESRSYTVQRWWLRKRLHRGLVTINGRWPKQPDHVHSFFNPCLTDQELADAAAVAANKEWALPVRIIYVGALQAGKGVERVLRIAAAVNKQGFGATVDLAGDGPERARLEQLASSLGITQLVHFHGWLARPALADIYAKGHIMVFPSESEGWPKALSEAMAYGVVPLASNVSCIPQYLNSFGTGRTFAPADLHGFADAVAWYCLHPAAWQAEALKAVRAAKNFTYTSYLTALRHLLLAAPPPVIDHIYEEPGE